MEINISSAVNEIKSAMSSLETYQNSLKDYLENPALIPPDFVTTALDFTQTLATASLIKGITSNAIGGYLTDMTNHLMGFQREINIRYKTKAAYYQEAISETELEATNFAAMGAEYVAAIQGKVPL